MPCIWDDLKPLRQIAKDSGTDSDKARVLIVDCIIDLNNRISLIERRYVKRRAKPVPPTKEDWIIQGYTQEGMPVYGVEEIKK